MHSAVSLTRRKQEVVDKTERKRRKMRTNNREDLHDTPKNGPAHANGIALR